MIDLNLLTSSYPGTSGKHDAKQKRTKHKGKEAEPWCPVKKGTCLCEMTWSGTGITSFTNPVTKKYMGCASIIKKQSIMLGWRTRNLSLK